MDRIASVNLYSAIHSLTG